jgi:putative zinc finger protein
MKRERCVRVRGRLAACYDGELRIEEQIAVEHHLRGCPSCARQYAELQAVGSALRSTAATRTYVPNDLSRLTAAVISRVKAERDQSFVSRMNRLFEDSHLLWTALGATGATMACVAVMVGLFYFAARERPDSLSAVLSTLASPNETPLGSNENPLSMDGRMRLPSAYPEHLVTTAADNEEESVFALAATVTREGRIASLELLGGNNRSSKRGSAADRQATIDLLDAISKARFEPARSGGSPVAVNMVWLLAHLTVRGKMPVGPRVPGRSLSISQGLPVGRDVAA